MPAPQRPMRRAPQMRKTMPSRAAQVQRRAADAIPPASGQAEIRPTRPRADRPRSGCAGEPAASPGNRLPPASARPPPAQHLSYPLPAEPPRSIPPALVRQAPGRPRRTFETPVSTRTFARLPPMSAFSRPPADEQTTTRKSAVRCSPQHAASASSPPPRRPHDSAPSLFPAGRSSDASAQTAEPPRTPFRSDLHSGAFRRAPVFSPAPVKPRAAPALLPFPARIPTSPPRSALPLVPASDPPRFPRAFSCAFPALLPHSIPPFCASFVKKHHKVRAAAQNLCNAAHLRALRPGLRSNCPATSPAGHRSPT